MAEEIKKRSTYGEGSTYFHKKSNTWISQKYVDTYDGKKQRISATGDTKAKAVRNRNAKIKTFQENQKVEQNKRDEKKESVVSFQDYTERWLTTTCKLNVEITTYENYCYYFYSHIMDSWLGETPINLIMEEDLTKYYDEKITSGRRDGKGGLSIRSVNYLRFLIKGSLRRAYDKGMISLNPHSDIKKIKKKVTNTEFAAEIVAEGAVHPLNPAEMNRFKEVLSEYQNRLKYLFLFTLGTGLRKGEVTGMLWSDIDFEKKVLYVTKSLAFTKGTPKDKSSEVKSMPLLKGTKTDNSKRRIRLNNSLINCLLMQKKQQDIEKVLYKDIYTDRGLVFSTETGYFLSPRKVLAEVKKVYKLADIDTTHTFHDLRHTFCSILINKGIILKEISRIMGHSSITVTLDVYSTIFEENELKSAEETEDILDMPEI